MSHIMLQTPRLTLFLLTAVQLSLALQDVSLLAEDVCLPIVAELVTPPVRRAVTMKLGKMADLPGADFPWFTYWLIVVQQDGFFSEDGGCGLAADPAAAQGLVVVLPDPSVGVLRCLWL